MQEGKRNPNAELESLGLDKVSKAYWNLSVDDLVQKTIDLNQGEITQCGALMVDTGEFKGRSPKDRFIVKDDITEGAVDWGNINIPFDISKFDALKKKMLQFIEGKEVYVRDSYACAEDKYRINIRVVTDTPWQSLFANNLFLRPTDEEIINIMPDWEIIAIPSFEADPNIDGTRQGNFAILNFTEKCILIGGTAYTGEIKKGIFSVLNFVLPHQKNVLSMHCSANVGAQGDTAVFFGLSGTGKTTLSADPKRKLIGDDEHGWSDTSVFNFEGGCYAKCVDLTEEKEPQIFHAIKHGALLENVITDENNKVDYSDVSKTENTRVGYPIDYIDNIVVPSIGKTPKNIFFLTYDAFGVIPPISKLTKEQAMFHFISGYTSKVAGTEVGITEPQTTFSACFGAPFMPLHPTKYAEMLGEKMEANDVNVWLINTGLSGGAYGTGERLKLSYTRSMITAALEGKLDEVEFELDPIFGLLIPDSCPNIPSEILTPKNTWADKSAFDKTANDLAKAFNDNFEQYADQANAEILSAAPKVSATV